MDRIFNQATKQYLWSYFRWSHIIELHCSSLLIHTDQSLIIVRNILALRHSSVVLKLVSFSDGSYWQLGVLAV